MIDRVYPLPISVRSLFFAPIMRPLIFICLLLLNFSVVAQETTYANPLDGELILSGNFGEVRTNHFHSGLDIKTGGVEGKSVYAVADGFVTRISVGGGGFGKAIYLEHPNGKTTVYGHLSAFAPEIAKYVKEQQYAKRSFEVDLTVPPALFPVQKGAVIAKSGNSGGSGGPHLHFEIRETIGQHPENPLNYGFEVKDNRKPELQKLWVYVHSNSGHVEGLVAEKGFALKQTGDKYSLTTGDTIRASGTLSFGLAALDRFTSASNVCGIYSMKVKVGDAVIHEQKIDKIPFDKKRMVNCHIDYQKNKTESQKVYRTYIAPGNTLSLYSSVINGGTVKIETGKYYAVQMDVRDHEGNLSKLNFTIHGHDRTITALSPTETVTELFYPKKENSFSNHSLQMTIPPGCIYDTLKFKYDLKPACKGCVSAVHSIGKILDTPLDNYMSLSIKMNELSEAKMQKAIMVSFNSKGNPISEGGTAKHGWMNAKTRSFGDHAVMLDSVAPRLTPKNFKDQTSTTGLSRLEFTLSDNLAGVKTVTGTLNGKWVLLEQDPKNSLLYYTKDERFINGQNTFRISATDAVGNVRELNVTVQ
ncbi:MAG: M23 family metallopeptidase [Flavobacteriales bacterium]|nr:M23 family metallopeptidase [Flavobacteriales bacterium]